MMELNDEQRKKFFDLSRNIWKQMASADEETTSLIEKLCKKHNKDFNEIFNEPL